MAKTIVLNAKMRRTGVCGAAETLLVDRAGAPTQLKPLITMLLDAGCEVRGDEATRAVDPRGEARERGGLVDRISRRHHRRQGGRRRRRRDRDISSATAPTTPIRSSPRTRPRRRNSCARSIPRSSCTMPRPNSPTAASSASAPRSASPPAASTPAARSASSNSPASSTASAARDRSGRDQTSAPNPKFAHAVQRARSRTSGSKGHSKS